MGLEREENTNTAELGEAPREGKDSKATFESMVQTAKETVVTNQRAEGISRRDFLKVAAFAVTSPEKAIPVQNIPKPDRENLEVRVRILEQKEKYLKQYYGENYPGYLEELKNASKQRPLVERLGVKRTNPDELLSHLRKNPESIVSKMPDVSEVAGSDSRLSPADVGEILEKTYPKGWVKNEILAVQQTDKKKSQDFTTVRGRTLDLKKLGYKTDKKMIELRAGDEKTRVIINDVLAHELAHANDWGRDNDLDPEQKIELLHAVTQRLEKNDDLAGLQLKIIKNWLFSVSISDAGKGSALQNGRWLIAHEYWAEICRQYFEDPSKLHPEDLKIVDGHIRRTDPQFDTLKAKKLRDSILTRHK